MSGRIVAVVPARGGSRGIARKNLAQVGGRPMLAWAVRAALDSGVVDRVIVSTDDAQIAEAARRAGAEVPFMRPPALAADAVHAVHVALHALEWIGAEDGGAPEGVAMLLPTSPMRRAEDVRGAVELFDRHRAEAVIGVSDLGKYMTNLRYLQRARLVRVAPGEDPNAQRQGQSSLHAVNGAIFLARPEALRKAGTFHLPGALGYPMGPLESIDVNAPADLELARRLFQALEPWKSAGAAAWP